MHIMFICLITASILCPIQAHAAVKIGAGTVKTAPQTPIPATHTAEDIPPPPKIRRAVKEQQENLPLAQSIAEAFRTDIETLKTNLARQATQKLRPEHRQAQQDKFIAYINTDHILSLYTKTLLTYFTKEELKTLRTFLAEPEGQNIIKKLVEVLNKIQLDRQAYLQHVLNQLVEEQVYEKLRKGEKTLLTP